MHYFFTSKELLVPTLFAVYILSTFFTNHRLLIILAFDIM